MNLKILQPDKLLVDEQVSKVTVEDVKGALTLLPQHIDFTTKLVPSILSYVTAPVENKPAQTMHAAIDESILVKKEAQVFIATREGICCSELEQLRQAMRQRFQQRDRRELKARTVLTRLESSIMKQFIELE
jgi:F-type H+-transporting ATPase subunit epsilon